MFIPRMQSCVVEMKIYNLNEAAKDYNSCLIYVNQIKEYPEKCYPCQVRRSMNWIRCVKNPEK